MKFKVLYILVSIGFVSPTSNAQRGVRIGYIDTEYILQNVPDYQEASSQLDGKIAKWKSEVEKKLADIESKKKALENEKVLLTKELYDERFEDLSFEEAEVLDYQQKRFGPNGDMVIQRTQLMQPVQDQIFVAVKEIAENKKYDFVFDKNSDFLMLYSAERFDISEQVLRIITRASNREQARNKKEKRELEKEEVVPETNSSKEERQKALEDRKAKREAELEQKRLEREQALEERRQAQKEAREAKSKEVQARRQRVLDARNGKAQDSTTTKDEKETLKENTVKEADSSSMKEKALKDVKETATKKSDTTKVKTAKELLAEKREKAKKDREARQKALEERKKRIIEQRKKAREERLKELRKNDSIRKAKANNN